MTQTHANQTRRNSIASRNISGCQSRSSQASRLPPFNATVKAEALGRWVAIMKSQDMLTSPVNADKLVIN